MVARLVPAAQKEFRRGRERSIHFQNPPSPTIMDKSIMFVLDRPDQETQGSFLRRKTPSDNTPGINLD